MKWTVINLSNIHCSLSYFPGTCMKMETLHNVQMCVGSEDLGPVVTFINSAIPIGLLCDWNAAFTLGKV